MRSASSRFDEAIERAAQEEQRRIRDGNREDVRQRKIATRRQIIIGGIVAKYFQAVNKLEPKLNQKDTAAEFAGLDKFFSTVANDPEYAALFRELVGGKS